MDRRLLQVGFWGPCPNLRAGSSSPTVIGRPGARSCCKTQLIFVAEILPYLVSLPVWYERGFLDNDGARAALSKAFSGRPETAQIIHDAITVEEALGVNAAFFRVPTSSNIADGPTIGTSGKKQRAWVPIAPRCPWYCFNHHSTQRMKHKGGAVVRGEKKGSCVDAPHRVTTCNGRLKTAPSSL